MHQDQFLGYNIPMQIKQNQLNVKQVLKVLYSFNYLHLALSEMVLDFSP